MTNKKIYAYRKIAVFTLKDGHTFKTSLDVNLTYMTPEEIESIAESWDIKCSVFEEALELAKNNEIPEAHFCERWFHKKPCLAFDDWGGSTYLKESEFDSVHIQLDYKEATLSIKTLAERLEATAFLEFCKDNSAAVCIDINSK